MDILILGASTRAAAFSASRASLQPAAIDLFADRDLAAVGPVLRIARQQYPKGLAALSRTLPPAPWIYTGGLENHPDLVDRIAVDRPLWGNGGAVLRAVRDPFGLAAGLRRWGLPCPEVRRSPRGLPRDGSWLVKPIGSAGGVGVHRLDAEAEAEAEDAGRPCYFQERIPGPAFSAVFVACADRAMLAGVTRQLLGRPGAPFAYAGSLGPWPLTASELLRIDALGVVLARSFGLLGLFGVDLILRDGHPWPVEVNPRYTASVEVLELALGCSLLSAHRQAWDPQAVPARPSAPPGPPRCVGKRILYAPARCRFPDLQVWRLRTSELVGLPRLGDIPPAATEFEPGEPVATVFAAAESPEDCRLALDRRAARWERRLLVRNACSDQSVFK